MLTNKYYTPVPALQEFVSSIWILGFVKQDGKIPTPAYSVVPMPHCCISFEAAESKSVKIRKPNSNDIENSISPAIIGPYINPSEVWFNNEDHVTILAILKPGALFRLLGFPVQEVINKCIDARSLFGIEIDSLKDRLGNTHDWEALNNIIQHFLVKKFSSLSAAIPFDKVMGGMSQHKENMTVEHLSSLSCLCLRQFERKCKERLGMSPKLYLRLLRFLEAYQQKQLQPQLNWAQVACRCGYHDQMHLIRDFKTFMGAAPSIPDFDDCFILGEQY